MKGSKMQRIAKMALIVGLCTLGVMLPRAKADDWNQKITFTFNGPVEVPGKVLSAGTYVFKLASHGENLDVVQVFGKNERKLYGTFLTIPDYRLKPTGKPVITFDERAAGSPEAVKAWFYPGFDFGHEFVYPKAKAVELAKVNNTPVPSMPNEAATDTTKPETLKQTPLKAQKPTGEEVEVAEVFEVPPAAATLPKKLPKTASQLPLIGLIGLLSLGMAVSLRFAAAKTR